MRMGRVVAALLLAVLLTAGLGVAHAPEAQASPTGYYSLAYTDELIYHYDRGGVRFTYGATYDQWRGDGFPTPTRATSDYVKYPWSPTIYAVTFFGADRDDWVWDTLSYDQWQRAGSPTARDAGWIDGSRYYRWGSNASEIFVEGPDGTVHRLTLTQWQAAGSPGPETRWLQGYFRYPWSSSIGYLYDTPTGSGYPVSYSEWISNGAPTPQTVTHVNGEDVWKSAWSSQLYLDSPITGLHQLSYSEWAALGFPAPTAP